MGEVITIDNFTSRMSPFDGTKNALYALVDMGSNGIRFSISDLSPPRSRLLHCIYRERAGISLYDALHEETPDSKPFHFSQNTISQVSQTLARFRGICDSYGVPGEHTQVFATEAMRTAENRDAMLRAIKGASGLTVDILSPGMESLFGAMGARSGFDHVDGLFMDLGGGSVQMTYVNSKEEDDYDILAAEAAKSMPYGAAKLTAALSTQATAHSTKTELKTMMKETFEGMKKKFPQLNAQIQHKEGVTIYFCGDPIQPYPIPAIGGYTVPGSRFVRWDQMLKANGYDGKIYGLSKRRRDQFPAIVTVVQALIEAVPIINKVIFCSGGNREGVLYMKLPPDVRESHPGPFLPGTQSSEHGIVHAVVDKLTSALPTDKYPPVFSASLLHYVARNIWIDMGDPADANSAKALHTPISGSLAGLPGLDHQSRAILALTMCARWGTDIGPIDKILFSNLRLLIGAELSWWCDYIGTTSRLLGTVIPVSPTSVKDSDIVSLHSSTSAGLGKKGHKIGIRLRIKLVKKGGADGLAAMFNSVGKNLSLDWKVEAEVEDLQ
ncbi:Retrograde regulation 2 [Hyphodiscus hymeniophilus]|uniref:Retrograde regulation 2 n=1 Tax=Hyphodiscus hymeniophilus TaxID=353542 RepID=A0A9P7AZ73_9HELO|nr:Retrograde regulation 2 [Hyphodiscus hymeniophilus]